MLTTFYLWPTTSVGMQNFLFVTTLPRADLQEYGIAESRDFLFLPLFTLLPRRGVLRSWALSTPPGGLWTVLPPRSSSPRSSRR
jgi:hypothetical protein